MNLGVFDPQGPIAAEMNFLFWVLVGLGAAVFLAFAVLIVIGLLRREATDDDASRRFLVGGGLAMPAIVIAVAFGFTLSAMRAIDVEPGDLAVKVVGHQWWWEVEYDGFTTANEIVIPAGEPVLVEMVSADVIHSFWVAQLGSRVDLLPDYPTSVVLEADAPGKFLGVCGEFCGLQHARMRFVVVAVTPEEFDAWAEGQRLAAAAPSDTLTERGLQVFVEADCGQCHTIRGTPADGVGGPDLTHLAARDTLAAGTVPNDPVRMAEWIRSPDQLKQGVSMPPTPLSDGDMDALVAYLAGLK